MLFKWELVFLSPKTCSSQNVHGTKEITVKSQTFTTSSDLRLFVYVHADLAKFPMLQQKIRKLQRYYKKEINNLNSLQKGT